METGARVTLDIVDLTEKGYGVAKAEGAVFFVRNGIPGDRVEAEIEEVRKRYFIANTVGLLQRSQDRIEPACRDCSLCGGCALSHASFELENRTKADTVRNAFKKAGIPLDFPEQAFALDRFGYRNKLTVHYSEELGAFGLYSEKTHSVFPFRECLLCPGIFSDCLRYINSIPEYFRDSCPDELIFQINGNGEVYITMKSRKRMNNRFRELVRARFPSVKEVLSSTPFRTEKSFFEDAILNFSLT
ncbi:MAG: TRAM domain-containing protein, partial [Clostridia bacterium]|nr:TRAM domain-containing protein [Clostridia bacterium]